MITYLVEYQTFGPFVNSKYENSNMYIVCMQTSTYFLTWLCNMYKYVCDLSNLFPYHHAHAWKEILKYMYENASLFYYIRR